MVEKLDKYSSLFWLFLAIIISFHSYRLGIGSVNDPGPGFIFFYSGIFISILSVIVFARSFVKVQDFGAGKIFENVHWLKVILAFTYILMFAIFLERLGFIITTFLLIALLLRTIESKSLFTTIFVGLAASFVTYGLFELWLHVRLPKGILGF